MSMRPLLQAFATVFPAELPDKTMVATIILVARFRRPLAVWCGAVAAFTVHVVVAVGAGTAIGLLPETAVRVGVAVLFTVGAVALFRVARTPEPPELDEIESDDGPADTVRTAVLGSFGLIIVAEWGDLTQLATASLAAKSAQPVATGIGAWLALASVAAIAAAFGRQLVARVPIHLINYIGAAVFAGLAAWTVVELIVQ